MKPNNLKNIPIILVEIEDSDLLKMITGGLSGTQALATKKIKIVGDYELAQELGSLFLKAGGVEKTLEFLKKPKSKL